MKSRKASCCRLEVEGSNQDEPRSEPAARVEYCDSEMCDRGAGIYEESLSTTVTPCEDFHTYVCSGWMRERHLFRGIPRLRNTDREFLQELHPYTGGERDSSVKPSDPEEDFQQVDPLR